MQTHTLMQDFDWRPYERLVVLSPHLDDAPLSCCGLIDAALDRLPVHVVTICAANPAPHPNLTADEIAQARQTDPEREFTVERRREDAKAMEKLGVNWTHLGFEDAIYRRSPTSGERIYQSSRERWVEPRIDDARHIEELFVVLRRMCHEMGPTLLCSPMSIGYHIDHAVTAHVAMRLEGDETDLLFYEDFPYVVDPSVGKGIDDGPADAFSRLRRQPKARYAVPVDVDTKVDVLSCYPSQMPILFDEADGVRQTLEDHTHDGQPTEFFWTAEPLRST